MEEAEETAFFLRFAFFFSIPVLRFMSSLCLIELFAGEDENGVIVAIVIGGRGEVGEVYWFAEAVSDFVPC
jgi:hypothetical protein